MIIAIVTKADIYVYYHVADIFTVVGGRNDSTVFLERISPEVIFLRPPEKLVIEVKPRGRVILVQWSKNVNQLSGTLGVNFAYHREIYVQEETTQADIGLYEVQVFPDAVVGQRLVPNELDFIVTYPGNFIISIFFRLYYNLHTF